MKGACIVIGISKKCLVAHLSHHVVHTFIKSLWKDYAAVVKRLTQSHFSDLHFFGHMMWYFETICCIVSEKMKITDSSFVKRAETSYWKYYMDTKS